MGIASAALMAAQPANAVLQVAFSDGTHIFTCADGQSCDEDGAAKSVLLINTVVGNFRIEGTFTQSFLDGTDQISFSNLTIANTGATTGHLSMVTSDTSFAGPVAFIRESGSLTFNDGIGSPLSTIAFFADKANGQGAGGGLLTPGTELFHVSGTPTHDPDSFSGSALDPFFSTAPFSMTEAATLGMVGGSSVTGFNQAMEAGVPEPSTWAMLVAGFGLLGLFGLKKARTERLSAI